MILEAFPQIRNISVPRQHPLYLAQYIHEDKTITLNNEDIVVPARSWVVMSNPKNLIGIYDNKSFERGFIKMDDDSMCHWIYLINVYNVQHRITHVFTLQSVAETWRREFTTFGFGIKDMFIALSILGAVDPMDATHRMMHLYQLCPELKELSSDLQLVLCSPINPL